MRTHLAVALSAHKGYQIVAILMNGEDDIRGSVFNRRVYRSFSTSPKN